MKPTKRMPAILRRIALLAAGTALLQGASCTLDEELLNDLVDVTSDLVLSTLIDAE